MIKEYKSELGKLYQSKREEAPLQKIVFEVYSFVDRDDNLIRIHSNAHLLHHLRNLLDTLQQTYL